MGRIRQFIGWLMGTSAPVATPAAPATRGPMQVNSIALASVVGAGVGALKAYELPDPPKWLAPDMAMDRADNSGLSITDLYSWALGGSLHEGLGFLGYPYLAELSQRPEYRRVVEIWAAEATRKWIKLSGNEERIDLIEKAMKRFKLRDRFRVLAEKDGFFGRAQLFVDLGHAPTSPELSKPLIAKAKIKPGSLKGFTIIEPFWSYPGTYQSTNPLAPDFYRPSYWYVMASRVHSSRLFTIVGREMPDMLKPAYSFGGLAQSQMIKPYVDNWLRARQSVSDLLHSFSTMVLATDMNAILQGGAATGLTSRLELYAATRDNRGVMAINKETEELTNVATPLGSLDKILAQSQEQIASVSGIPLVILLGVTPSGLNASSDGEVRTFYATIKSYQEEVFRDPLAKAIDLIQLDLDGTIDPDITFEFVDLWETPETEKANVRKSDADMDVAYVGAGIVSNEEVRARIVQDEDSPYYQMDLSAEAPEPPEDDSDDPFAGGGDDEGDDKGDDPKDPGNPPAKGQAHDAAEFEESKHPRADNGKFGSGGGGAAPKDRGDPPAKGPTTAKGRIAERTAKERDTARAAAVEAVTNALPAKGELPSPAAARQPFSTWEEAEHLAKEGFEQFTGMLDKVAEAMGLTTGKTPQELTEDAEGSYLLIGPIKTREKSEAKAQEYETDDGKPGDLSQVKDLVRATIACDSVKGVAEAIETIKKAGLKFATDPKNNFANPKSAVGYRDINTLVELPNGMIAELQFNVTSMVVAKEKAHAAYNETIKIEQTLKASPPPDDGWPAEDAKRYEELEEFQKQHYAAAWERAK